MSETMHQKADSISAIFKLLELIDGEKLSLVGHLLFHYVTVYHYDSTQCP